MAGLAGCWLLALALVEVVQDVVRPGGGAPRGLRAPSTLLRSCPMGRFRPNMKLLLEKYPFLVEGA